MSHMSYEEIIREAEEFLAELDENYTPEESRALSQEALESFSAEADEILDDLSRYVDIHTGKAPVAKQEDRDFLREFTAEHRTWLDAGLDEAKDQDEAQEESEEEYSESEASMVSEDDEKAPSHPSGYQEDISTRDKIICAGFQALFATVQGICKVFDKIKEHITQPLADKFMEAIGKIEEKADKIHDECEKLDNAEQKSNPIEKAYQKLKGKIQEAKENLSALKIAIQSTVTAAKQNSRQPHRWATDAMNIARETASKANKKEPEDSTLQMD